MSRTQKIAAFVSGILLCLTAMFVYQMHAQFPFPARFYDEDVGNLVFSAINTSAVIVPIFVLSWAWSSTTLRWLARPGLAAFLWMLGGLLIGMFVWEVCWGIHWYYWYVHWVADMNRQMRAGTVLGWVPKDRTIWDYLPKFRDLVGIVYLWRDPVFCAMVSGIATATATALRSKRPPSQPLAQESPREASESPRNEDRPGHTPFIRAGATT